MKKLSFIILLLCLGLQFTKAQRILNYENQSDRTVTYDGGDDEAGVVLQCKASIILDFESNMDNSVNVYNVEKDAEKNITTYYLIFTSGRRTLTVKADSYNSVDIPLNLKPHQLDVYRLFDPNDRVDGTYYQLHRERGQKFFDNCDYVSARDEFQLALNWDEITPVDETEAKGLVANCDSILTWRRLGFEAADMLDFDKASEYLMKAQNMNPLDRNIVNKVFECDQLQANRCKDYLDAGNKYFENKEYADAILMFKKVEDRNCEETSLALSQRIKSETLLQSRRNLERYFGVEIGHMFGITYGKYRKITGSYITLKANSPVLDITRSDYKPEDRAEIDLSFGWTFPVVKEYGKIFRGVWIHAGFGVAAINDFKVDKKFNKEIDGTKTSLTEVEGKVNMKITDKNVPLTNEHMAKFVDAVNEAYNLTDNKQLEAKDFLDLNLGFAVTPELGLTVKIWHFALRGTYQYCYSVNKDFEELFGKSKFSFGVGFCW